MCDFLIFYLFVKRETWNGGRWNEDGKLSVKGKVLSVKLRLRRGDRERGWGIEHSSSQVFEQSRD